MNSGVLTLLITCAAVSAFACWCLLIVRRRGAGLHGSLAASAASRAEAEATARVIRVSGTGAPH